LAGLILLACVLMPFFDSGYVQARVLQTDLGILLFVWGTFRIASMHNQSRKARPS